MSASHAEDLKLVAEVLSGDPRARSQFGRRMGCVVGIVTARNERMGRPLTPHEVEDVIQNSLTAIWRKLRQFKGNASLETWAYHFCSLEMLDGLRLKRRHPRAMQSLEDHLPSPEPEMDSAHCYDDIHEGLEKLDRESSAVIRLKTFEGLTFEEISTRTNSSVNTAKSRYYRALDRLRTLLPHRSREVQP